MENYQDDSIDLRELYINIAAIIKEKKKYFLILFLIIMSASIAYFTKIIVSPKYESKTLVKTSFINKNQFESYCAHVNHAIEDNFENAFLPENLQSILKDNFVKSVKIKQLNPDANNPDKIDLMNHYELNIIYNQKPNSKTINQMSILIDYFRAMESKQSNIIGGKIRVKNAIKEVDSLIKISFIAGNEFKKKINSNNGSMLVVSDLYKTVNEIIATKKNLESELFQYQTENLICQKSPFIISKSIKSPYLVWVIGFFLWFIISTVWVFILLIFRDNKNIT